MKLKCCHIGCKKTGRTPFYLWILIRDCWLCEDHRCTEVNLKKEVLEKDLFKNRQGRKGGVNNA
ncbi:hypothetical protein KAR91_74865 [Candidatus Pacearchaeota archaeon]|nr:hypothetical protein [Candidatus Pacearchaeota archaeon]